MKRRFLAVALIVVLAAGVASCAGEDQRGSPAHRMSVWVGGTGFGEDVGTLVADNARVPKVVSHGSGAVHAACGTMEDDALSANQELPTPDAKVTNWLSDAYNLEGAAANECYDAGSTNKKLLAEAERDTAKATALFQRVLARIRVIDGAVPSTTTTTDNAPTGIFG